MGNDNNIITALKWVGVTVLFGGVLVAGMACTSATKAPLVVATATPVPATEVPTPEAVIVEAQTPTSLPQKSTADTTDDLVVANQAMERLLAKARHIRGDPNAPVTIVEFSDFK